MTQQYVENSAGIEPCTKEIAKLILEGLNTPISMGIWMRLHYAPSGPSKLMDEIATASVDPSKYLDKFRFRDDYLAVSLLKKAEFLNTTFDQVKAAEKSFLDAEKSCLEANKRIANMWKDPLSVSPLVSAVLALSSRRISQVLGDMPKVKDIQFGFGPGASSSCKGSKSSSYYKINARLDCTLNCLPLLPIVRECHAWMKIHGGRKAAFEIVDGGKLSFVNKNAKTKRPIITEPTVNTWLQKGFGKAVRDKLYEVGLVRKRVVKTKSGKTFLVRTLRESDKWALLNKMAKEHHMSMARLASLSDEIATVDLTSASETIAYNLVADQLGNTDWFHCLDCTRSPDYTYKGKRFTLEKFSSMGNGFTFELETLLFYALAWASCKYAGVSTSVLTVFGDDIIIPSKVVPVLKEVFDFCGFTFNDEKSYVTGPFKESCGGHFFSGLDVTPLYIKEEITNVYEGIILANRIRKLAQRRNGYGCDITLNPAWELAVDFAYTRNGSKRLPVGPINAGDGHLHVDFDQARPHTFSQYGERWFKIRSYVSVQRSNRVNPDDRVYPDLLYRSGAAGKVNVIDVLAPSRRRNEHDSHYKTYLRDENGPKDLVDLITPEWCDMGPWI